MKFSSSTYLALAFATVAVQATPIAIPAADAVAAASPAAYPFEYPKVDFAISATKVKRADIENIKSIIAGISHINSKREFAENDEELALLHRRAVGGFANLVSALQSSGILYDVIKTFISSDKLKSALSVILSAVLAEGWNIITGVWESGLLGKLVSDFLGSTDLLGAIIAVIPDTISIIETLVSVIISVWSSPTSTTTTASSSASAGAKREYFGDDFDTTEYIDKKDLSGTVSEVTGLIQQSGLLSTALNFVESSPADAIHYAINAFRLGFASSEEAYTWFKNSGILDSTLASLIEDGGLFGSFASQFGDFVGSTVTTNPTYSSDLPDGSYAAPFSPSNQPELYSKIIAPIYGTSAPSPKKRSNY